jgi:hypothetical protein
LANRPKPEWLPLREAFYRICHESHFPPSLAEEALENALRSGRVSFQGVPHLKGLLVSIDGRHVRELRFDIDQNEIYLTAKQWNSPPNYHSVEVDWRALEPFVRKSLSTTREPPRPSRPAVTKAIRESVKRHQEADKRPTRRQHIAEIRKEWPGMTEDQYDEFKEGIVPPEWSRPGRHRRR